MAAFERLRRFSWSVYENCPLSSPNTHGCAVSERPVIYHAYIVIVGEGSMLVILIYPLVVRSLFSSFEPSGVLTVRTVHHSLGS